jgi:hypothetical protein
LKGGKHDYGDHRAAVHHGKRRPAGTTTSLLCSSSIERAEFSERRARVDQVLDDLLDAERKLIRAQERASGERS